MSGGMMRLPLGTYFENLERERGLPPGYLARTRAIESANGRNTYNAGSKATGDFQFIPKTAAAFNLDPTDPYASAKAAADYGKQNADLFQRKFGRTPTGADLYGMHQQGPQGYVDLMGGKVNARNLASNGGAGMSADGFINKLYGMYNGAKPGNLGIPTPEYPGANRGQGPTVASADAQAKAYAPFSDTVQGPGFPGAGMAAPAPDNSQATFNGGLLGLAQGSDYQGAGDGKDMMGKIGDTVKGADFGSAMKGLAALAGGGGTSRPAPVQPLDTTPGNTPNLSFLQMMQPPTTRRRLAMGMGV